MHPCYFVYILASEKHELYIGMTNDMGRRLWEHQNHVSPSSYSSRHGTTRLVYYETTTNVSSAIRREKELKRYPRQKKLTLISGKNPDWRDLATDPLPS